MYQYPCMNEKTMVSILNQVQGSRHKNQQLIKSFDFYDKEKLQPQGLYRKRNRLPIVLNIYLWCKHNV